MVNWVTAVVTGSREMGTGSTERAGNWVGFEGSGVGAGMVAVARCGNELLRGTEAVMGAGPVGAAGTGGSGFVRVARCCGGVFLLGEGMGGLGIVDVVPLALDRRGPGEGSWRRLTWRQ